MNELKPIKVKAQTISDALSKAASILGVPTSEIEYKEVKKNMFSSLFSSRIEIIAEHKKLKNSKHKDSIWAKEGKSEKKSARSFKSPRKRGEDAHLDSTDSARTARSSNSGQTGPRRVRKKPESLTPEIMDGVKKELSEYLETICKSLLGQEIDLSLVMDQVHEQDRLNFHIKSTQPIDEKIQINGRLLDALEHLVRKKPRHLKQEIPFKVLIDIDGFREERKVHLKEVALDVATKVAETKEPASLKYKSSYDRKVIHMALESDSRVYTKSVGMGSRRKLMVFPSDQA